MAQQRQQAKLSQAQVLDALTGVSALEAQWQLAIALEEGSHGLGKSECVAAHVYSNIAREKAATVAYRKAAKVATSRIMDRCQVVIRRTPENSQIFQRIIIDGKWGRNSLSFEVFDFLD